MNCEQHWQHIAILLGQGAMYLAAAAFMHHRYKIRLQRLKQQSVERVQSLVDQLEGKPVAELLCVACLENLVAAHKRSVEQRERN